jgi:hypothetical protein
LFELLLLPFPAEALPALPAFPVEHFFPLPTDSDDLDKRLSFLLTALWSPPSLL